MTILVTITNCLFTFDTHTHTEKKTTWQSMHLLFVFVVNVLLLPLLTKAFAKYALMSINDAKNANDTNVFHKHRYYSLVKGTNFLSAGTMGWAMYL